MSISTEQFKTYLAGLGFRYEVDVVSDTTWIDVMRTKADTSKMFSFVFFDERYSHCTCG